VELTGYQEITQAVPLIAGWNLFSTNTFPNPADLLELLEPLILSGQLVKVQDEQGRSIEDLGTLGGWTNMIGDLSAEEGYKIKVTGNCIPTFTGRPVPLPFEIPLTAGWNIIGFPGVSAVDGLKVVQQLIDRKTLVKVQDEQGRSIEDLSPFGSWVNNIGTFGPGEGFKVKVNADEVLTIQEAYTKGGPVVPAPLPTVHFTTKVRGNGTDHMNIHLVALPEGMLAPGDEVGVFDGEQCVSAVHIPNGFLAGIAEGVEGTGGVSPESPGHAGQVQPGGLQTLSMAISANDGIPGEGFTEGHPFTLMLWKAHENREYLLEPEILKGTATFVKHESSFASLAKYTITGSDRIAEAKGETFTLYPNPTTGKVYLSTARTAHHRATWQLLNAAGQLLREEVMKDGTVEIDMSGCARGVYYLKIKGEYGTEVKKIVLQ
jgi:hypothetical protein